MKRQKQGLWLLLLIHIVIGTSYAILTPLWQGHEADYYNVIRFLVTEQRFPTSADYPNGDADIRQATQPPLYFLIAAPIVALFDDAQPVPYGLHPLPLCIGGEGDNSTPYITSKAYNSPFQGSVGAAYALRLLNVLLTAAAVYFTYKTGRNLFANQPTTALIGAAILAFEPVTLQSVIVISNDALLLAACSAILFLCARLLMREQVSRGDIITVIALGISAPLIKLPGWAVLLLSLAALTYPLISQPKNRRILLFGVGLIALLTVAIGLFNYQNYGSVLGRYSVLDSFALSLIQQFDVPWVIIRGVIEQTASDFSSALALVHARAAFFTLYNLLLVLCFIAALSGLIAALFKPNAKKLRVVALLIGLTLITLIMVIFRNTLTANADNTTTYNTAMIFAPVRYYIPALPALALLVAAGCAAILPRISRSLLGVIPVTCFGLVSIAITVILIVERPANPVMSPSAFAALENVQRVALQPDENSPEILGYNLEQGAGWLDLTLYLTLHADTAINFAAQAEILEQQAMRSTCEFLPANGDYPSPRWTAGEIIVTHARIPNCAANLATDLSLALRWNAYSLNGDPLYTTSPVILSNLQQPLGVSETCPANLGVIGEGYQLLKWNSPAAVAINEVYLPSVNWIVLNPTSVPLRRVFTFSLDGTDTIYQCVGSPSEGVYPVQSWRRGETIYFDQCQMRFPADAPTGIYRVSVGFQNENGDMLSAVQPNGEREMWLFAGEVAVR